MPYRDDELAARSKLALLERERLKRAARAESLRGERRALLRAISRRGSARPGVEPPAPLALPTVEELARAVAGWSAQRLHSRARELAGELSSEEPALGRLGAEVERLRARLLRGPSPSEWPVWSWVAGGMALAGLLYILSYSLVVWGLSRLFF